jgi:hypothetical protein
MNRRVPIVLFVLLLLVGCFAKQTELYGRYEVTRRWGRAELILKRDATFEQKVILKDGKVLTASGKWKLGSEGEVEFDLLIHPEIESLHPGPVSLGSETFAGDVRLVFDDDTNGYYRKLSAL